ncbi:hypothetical protein HPB48_004194 [Haemaphysalis longicornis]|uniref:Sulfotransferase domain-containing protein n=1 Tax=Haemaphysalis longicornis TaxID=44386 RepID=A0A9J6GJC5_HAELO|nr:hypothetical protein HPB48_004194 [Haemaphysalis longicornis]
MYLFHSCCLDSFRYIYVTRNPYDCCVSYFHHIRDSPVYRYTDATFDDFLDVFIEGLVSCGDYFDHLLSWYEHRADDNVLLLTYEDLKEDTRGAVIKIADFLGNQYAQELRKRRLPPGKGYRHGQRFKYEQVLQQWHQIYHTKLVVIAP